MCKMSGMKAIIVRQPGGPDQLSLGEWEKPVPGQKEILVKVAATALNRADTLQRRGMYPPPPSASPILGLEMAGTVAALGPGCTRWKVGDAVCGLLAGGGYAEYTTIHEELAMPVPNGFSMEEAAAMPEVFLTAFQALYWLAKLKKGERILIHAGASGVGTAAIQLARKIGAEILVTASAPKHAVCRKLGATLAIDYKSQPFEEAVISFTSGEGVDVIIDFIAAPYLQPNLNCLRTDGRLVILALMGGIKVENLNMLPILRNRLHIMGSTLRARSLEYKIRLTRDMMDFVFEDFEKGSIKPVIDRVFDWKEVAEAHAYMEANKNTGKIVLRIAA